MSNKASDAPWRLWILIVLWVLQMLVVLGEFILFIHAVTFPNSNWRDRDVAAVLVEPVSVAVTLGLNITEIVLFAANNLSPKLYFISSVVKSIAWMVFMIVGLTTGYGGNFFNSIMSISILFTFLLSILYVATVFRQKKQNAGRENGSQNDIELKDEFVKGQQAGPRMVAYA